MLPAFGTINLNLKPLTPPPTRTRKGKLYKSARNPKPEEAWDRIEMFCRRHSRKALPPVLARVATRGAFKGVYNGSLKEAPKTCSWTSFGV